MLPIVSMRSKSHSASSCFCAHICARKRVCTFHFEVDVVRMQDQPRREAVLTLEGIKSLLAMLDNTSGGVQELALSVLGNLVRGDAETKLQVMVCM